MKHLKLAASVLAAVCATSAVAAQPNQTLYILHDTEGSHLRSGDVLVADGNGAAALYRGNAFVHMVQDPENLLSLRTSADKPIYITNAEGAMVHNDLAGYAGDLFISADAPQIVSHKREFYNPNRNYAGHGHGGTSLLSLHGGNVMVQATTYSIFWGSYGVEAGVAEFFNGFSGSTDAAASTEYYGSTNGHVSGLTTNSATYTDSNPPNSALSTSSAVAEVCKITNKNQDPNGIYFIFTSTGAGNVSYCAWHSWGSCGSTPVQVAYMPNNSGLAGCDPGAPYGSAGSNEGLASLLNVTSHELSEAITDPRGTGWTDSSGSENGDKCAWAFNPANGGLRSFGSYSFKVQGEWSNSAYGSSSGFANLSGAHGCIN